MARTQVVTTAAGRTVPLPPAMPRRRVTTSMAKTRARVAPVIEPEPPEVEEGEPHLKRATIRAIEAIRQPFRTYLAAFKRVYGDAEELAPAFHRAFLAWQADTQGTFIGFVRYLDPTVPAHRDEDEEGNPGYRTNPAYNAADYMRRFWPAVEGEEVEDKDKPAGMSEAFVRLLAAIVALIPGNQVEKLWGVIGTELHWSERRVTTLRAQVEEAEPLVESHVERNSLVVDAE